MSYEQDIRALKEQGYRRLLEEVETVREDTSHLYNPSEWAERDEIVARMIEIDDTELDEAIDSYHTARNNVQDVLAETSRFADLDEDVFENDARGIDDVPTTLIDSNLYGRRSYLSDTVMEYSDVFVHADGPADLQELTDAPIVDVLESRDEVADWQEFIWEYLEERADTPISTTAQEYNLGYAVFEEETARLEAMVEQRIETELLAGYDREDVPSYAS